MKIIVVTVFIVLFSTLLYSMDKQHNNPKFIFHQCNIFAIKKFLDEGGNPNIQNNIGVPLLYYPLVFNKIDCAELLLKNGANPDVPAAMDTTFTLLHQSVKESDIKSVQLLFKYNANPDIPDMDGNIPLHSISSILQDINAEEICKLLIEHTKNPFVKNKFGRSPYDQAPEKYKHLLTKIKEEPKLQKLRNIQEQKETEYARLQAFLASHENNLLQANLAALQSIRDEKNSGNRNAKSSTCTIF